MDNCFTLARSQLHQKAALIALVFIGKNCTSPYNILMINLRKILLATIFGLMLGMTNIVLAFDFPFLSQSNDDSSVSSKTASDNDSNSSWTSTAQEIILHALSQTGVKYKYGGINPDSGFDCSGFVRYVFQEAGI
jgi:hypothetical protein